MSAASCFLISCSSSLSAIVVDNRFSPAIFVVDNRFCSAIFRVNNRVIVGRRRVRISYCSERTRARSLWGGMSFICSAATSLYFRSFGGISVSMFRHNSSEHSRSLVVASVSGSLPSLHSLHLSRQIEVAPSSSSSRSVPSHLSAVFEGMPIACSVVVI
jgi:hypothetical protein